MHPFGEHRADLRMARLAATMVNMWKSTDSPLIEEDVFMLEFDSAPLDDVDDDIAIQQQQMMFMAATVAMGGKIQDGA